MWYGHGFGWVGMVVGGLLMLIVWGGLIGLFFWGLRAFVSKNNQGENDGGNALSAREILDRRYASGEISRDEYEAIKEDLSR
jgi:putative membrane protein